MPSIGLARNVEQYAPFINDIAASVQRKRQESQRMERLQGLADFVQKASKNVPDATLPQGQTQTVAPGEQGQGQLPTGDIGVSPRTPGANFSGVHQEFNPSLADLLQMEKISGGTAQDAMGSIKEVMARRAAVDQQVARALFQDKLRKGDIDYRESVKTPRPTDKKQWLLRDGKPVYDLYQEGDVQQPKPSASGNKDTEVSLLLRAAQGDPVARKALALKKTYSGGKEKTTPDPTDYFEYDAASGNPTAFTGTKIPGKEKERLRQYLNQQISNAKTKIVQIHGSRQYYGSGDQAQSDYQSDLQSEQQNVDYWQKHLKLLNSPPPTQQPTGK